MLVGDLMTFTSWDAEVERGRQRWGTYKTYNNHTSFVIILSSFEFMFWSS